MRAIQAVINYFYFKRLFNASPKKPNNTRFLKPMLTEIFKIWFVRLKNNDRCHKIRKMESYLCAVYPATKLSVNILQHALN